jgi:hypothetical protein
MTSWSTDELDRVGAADEIHITTVRSDGSLRTWPSTPGGPRRCRR